MAPWNLDDEHTWNVDKIERDVMARIAADRERGSAPAGLRRPAFSRTGFPRLTLALSACGAVLAVVVLVVWPRRVVSPFREFATAAGGRSSVITLRDGSQVTLAPATHLRVPADFGQESRRVELDGEAYFAVVHNPQRPFSVEAHGVETRDVGTSFDVRAYKDDPQVRVMVAEGEVSVAAVAVGREAVQLSGGDMATIAGSQESVRHHVDVATMTGWVQGHLVFEDTPLRDVVRDLSRRFDLVITIADTAMASHQVSGSFDKESVEEILNAITAVTGTQYERTGRAIVIRRCLTGVGREHRSTLRAGVVTAEASGRSKE